jgi:hypothetical protein
MDGEKDSSVSNNTEKEKNIVRAMRAFFKMDADRFNKADAKYKTYSEHLIELKDKDPITKIVARYSALKVAFKENEVGADKSNLSDQEWEYIKKIDDSINIKIVYDDIKDKAYELVNHIINYEKEKMDGYDPDSQIIINIWYLLREFFNSLEKNNLFDVWEENYLALLKYKSEMQDVFGKNPFLKEFDERYKKQKPLISNFKKEKIAKEKQLAKEKADFEKNKTHEYSVSNGIHYCRYCGGDEKWRKFDCQRELGHKYTLRRVQNKIGFDYSFQPVCNNCGDIRHYCQMDWKYKFKCK